MEWSNLWLTHEGCSSHVECSHIVAHTGSVLTLWLTCAVLSHCGSHVQCSHIVAHMCSALTLWLTCAVFPHCGSHVQCSHIVAHMCSNLKLWLTCLFVLRFYGPVNPMGSCRARSVYLTTRLLGRLSPLSG